MKITRGTDLGLALEGAEAKISNSISETMAKAVGTTPETKAVGTLPEAKAHGRLKEAQKVALDFETLFVDLMLKQMRQTAKPEDMSNAEEMFQGMLDGEYSKGMTEAQEFGIRSMILEWMKNAEPELAKTEMAEAKGKSQALSHYRAQSMLPSLSSK